MVTGSSHAAFGTGAIVVGAGVYAYFKKNSIASLLGSAALGGTIIIGGLLISQGKDFLGHATAAAGSTGLVLLGIVRYRATGKPMPAIPLILIGGASAAYQLNKANQWK